MEIVQSNIPNTYFTLREFFDNICNIQFETVR